VHTYLCFEKDQTVFWTHAVSTSVVQCGQEEE